MVLCFALVSLATQEIVPQSLCVSMMMRVMSVTRTSWMSVHDSAGVAEATKARKRK